jgi:hypothetical protein
LRDTGLAGRVGGDAAGAKCARQRPSAGLGTALNKVEGRQSHFAERGIGGRTGRSPAEMVGDLFLLVYVRIEPLDDEIGDLIAVPILHQHVAVAFDPERRQVHHLGIATGLLQLIDEHLAAGQ